MKLFDYNTENLKKSSPAKPSKRFVCWVIDILLVSLFAELIFAVLFQVVQITPAYKDAGETVKEEITNYEKLTEATHIVEYVDGKRATADVVVIKNLYRAICLSYKVFGNEQQPDFTFTADHDVMLNGIHSLDTDNVAYFYMRYLKENPDMAAGAEYDIFEIYRRSFGENASFMFSFNKELAEIPVLNTQIAYYLFHYLFIDSSDSIGQTGATYYQAYYNGYSKMLEDAEELILNSEPYNSTHYRDYINAYSAQARYTNIALVISIFVSAMLVLLIPKYLFKNEKTIGYKLLGLGVIRADGQANEWYVPLIKTVLDSIGAIPIAFILYLFPPFNGGFEAMFMPATPSNKISLAIVILFIGIAGAFVSAFELFTYKRQNLINVIFDDTVVDVNLIDDGERD